MAVAEIVTFAFTGGGAAIAPYLVVKLVDVKAKFAEKKQRVKAESEKVDGRTADEWFDLLKGMGRDEYEKISRGALDGLEEHDTYGRWDIKPLLKHRYDELLMQWYPEKYCKYCRKQGCKQTCDAYWAGMPPCKVCRKSLRDDTCDYCGYENFKWEAHPRKERGWTYYSDGNAEYKIRPARVDRPDTKALTSVISTGSGDNIVYITDGGMAMFTKQKIQISDFRVQGIEEQGYRISRNDKSWIVGRQEIKSFQRAKHLPVNGIMNVETKKAIVKYLDAGNPWPVKPERLTVSQAEQVQRELDKWKHQYMEDVMPKISRYDREGNAHW